MKKETCLSLLNELRTNPSISEEGQSVIDQAIESDDLVLMETTLARRTLANISSVQIEP